VAGADANLDPRGKRLTILRGKIFGLQNNAANIALSLPLVFTGLAEARLGLPWMFVALSVLAGLAGLYTWSLLGREVS
jgi:hypothetical protein